MIPQAYKDTVARKYGYKDWESFTWDKSEHAKIMMDVLEEAGLLYAQDRWDQACDEQKSACSFSVGVHSDILIYPKDFPKIHYRIVSAAKPEFKPWKQPKYTSMIL